MTNLARAYAKGTRTAAEGGFSGSLVTILDPAGAAAEAYRSLRTNLLFAFVDAPPKAIVFTSPGAHEGKSVTCANLGVVLAQADKRTLVVDCDLRRPATHAIFGLRNFWGLVNVLTGERPLPDAVQEPLPGLEVLTSGQMPPNPTELLGSRRFSDLLAGAREHYDYVLLDAPPIGPVSDPAILSSQGDGVMLVLNAQKTRKIAVRQARRSLDAVGANLIGTVMNNVKGRPFSYGYSTY